LLSLQPSIITNDRLKRPDFPGDIKTPEQKIPGLQELDSTDWETCMTMNGTWGYRTSDTNWKSASTLIRNLCDIASKGGNYLLNVGPKADGSFPEASVRLLGEIGNWMKVNGESIYGTQSANINQPSWGRITRKKGNSGTESLYLQVFEWPNNGQLIIPISVNKRVTVNTLNGYQNLPFHITNNQLIIDVPPKATDNWVFVIRVTLQLSN